MTLTGQPPAPIPLTVVTGFLGAGKTTFLNQALTEPALAGTLVIVNEFGTQALDQHLLAVTEDELLLLAGGCLCCTIRDSLTRLLEDLLRRRDNRRIPEFTRVIIETTGLADPTPVLATVLAHPYLSRRYRLSGVITLVDRSDGLAILDRHPEARRQVLLADALLLSKSDSAGSDAEPTLLPALATLNPAAQSLTTQEALADPAAVLFGSAFSPQLRTVEARRLLRRESLRVPAIRPHADHDANRHSDSIRALALDMPEPLGAAATATLLEALARQFGPRILRLKGLIAQADSPSTPLAIHMVQGRIATPQQLERWPAGVTSGWLQIIGENLDEAAVRAIIASFTPQP